MLKKFAAFSAFALMPILLLTSCDTHIGNAHYDVPWWVIAIPIVLILVIAHVCVICKRFQCPACQTEFRPKWYEISAWLHNHGERVVKCPHCGRRGFCPPSSKGRK